MPIKQRLLNWDTERHPTLYSPEDDRAYTSNPELFLWSILLKLSKNDITDSCNKIFMLYFFLERERFFTSPNTSALVKFLETPRRELFSRYLKIETSKTISKRVEILLKSRENLKAIKSRLKNPSNQNERDSNSIIVDLCIFSITQIIKNISPNPS